MPQKISQMTAAGTLLSTEQLEVSQLSTTVTITATTLSALASDNSFNDSSTSFVTAGFAANDTVKVTGFTGSGANNVFSATITALTAGKMTIGGTDGDVIVDDAAGESVTITKWNSRRVEPQGLAIERVNPQVGTTYTIVTGDRGKLLTLSNAAAIAVTLPQAGSNFPDGWFVDVKCVGAGTATITPTTSTIDGATTLVLTTNQSARIVSDGTNYRSILTGGSSGSTTPVLIQIAVSDETTALTAGTSKVTFRAPYAFTLTDVRASVTTAPTGGTLLTVDVNESGTTVLSTKLTFDASEKTTTTAATARVISDSAIADDAEITIDIDAIGSTIAGAGLKVTLIGTKP